MTINLGFIKINLTHKHEVKHNSIATDVLRKLGITDDMSREEVYSRISPFASDEELMQVWPEIVPTK